MCAGLLQSVPRGAAECVQGYRVCAGCSFNILPCSTRLNQKIFYWKKKYFIWMCIKNKNYMENWLFWGLNLGNLKQCMMIMLVLTSSSSAWTLCSLLHISSLINICNFYSFWATGMVLTSKWGRILQEIHCQCQIWLKWSAAGRRPANFHKRNYLLSVNTTDFEKTTIQDHSAVWWCRRGLCEARHPDPDFRLTGNGQMATQREGDKRGQGWCARIEQHLLTVFS